MLVTLCRASARNFLEDGNQESSRSNVIRGSGRQFNRTTEQHVAAQISCAIDISSGIFAVGKLSTSIYQAQRICPMAKTAKQQAYCATYVSSCIASSAGFLGSFLASAASTCAKTMTFPALCASASSEIVAVLGVIAAAASGIRFSCESAIEAATTATKALKSSENSSTDRRLEKITSEDNIEDSQSPLTNLTRRLHVLSTLPMEDIDERALSTAILETIKANEEAKRTRQVTIASCVFSGGMILDFAIRAALSINVATKVCKPFKGANSLTQELMCEVEIARILGSLTFTGALIALAVAACPVTPNLPAACAGDILALVAAVEGLLGVGPAMALTCR